MHIVERRGDEQREDVDESVLRDRAGGGAPDQGVRHRLRGHRCLRGPRPVCRHSQDGARHGSGPCRARGRGARAGLPAGGGQDSPVAGGGREAWALDPWQAGIKLQFWGKLRLCLIFDCNGTFE